jgi:hypothetical protein
VIETISPWRSVRLRHEAAPLLKEREQYLTHLLEQGFDRAVVIAWEHSPVLSSPQNGVRSERLTARGLSLSLDGWLVYDGSHLPKRKI